jgi:hypothetical protein
MALYKLCNQVRRTKYWKPTANKILQRVASATIERTPNDERMSMETVLEGNLNMIEINLRSWSQWVEMTQSLFRSSRFESPYTPPELSMHSLLYLPLSPKRRVKRDLSDEE